MDIDDIPSLPDRDQRIEEILVDTYGDYEQQRSGYQISRVVVSDLRVGGRRANSNAVYHERCLVSGLPDAR